MSKLVKINYPEEFIGYCRQIFSDDSPKLEELIKAIKNGDDNKVRIMIEDKLDSYEVPHSDVSNLNPDDIIKNLIRAGEASKLYSQYMELYNEVDS